MEISVLKQRLQPGPCVWGGVPRPAVDVWVRVRVSEVDVRVGIVDLEAGRDPHLGVGRDGPVVVFHRRKVALELTPEVAQVDRSEWRAVDLAEVGHGRDATRRRRHASRFDPGLLRGVPAVEPPRVVEVHLCALCA
jgi:hypothetical protein